jgi:hypothetical protein
VDLTILPESVELVEQLSLLSVKNKIHFTVKNIGQDIVDNIGINITFCYDDGSSLSLFFDDCISQISGFGAEKTYILPLFEIDGKNYIKSLIDFAGIKNITLLVDPEGKSGDINTNNNIYTINSGYKDIFTFFGTFPIIESFFKFLKDVT